MTEEQAKDFFEKHGNMAIELFQFTGMYQYISPEQFFQAIKARLKSEATCNCWSDKAVDG